jgi:putative tricarboxylic transport membrane protein
MRYAQGETTCIERFMHPRISGPGLFYVNSSAHRFTFDFPALSEGINFAVVAMGMFGLGEIISNLEHENTREVAMTKVNGLMPTKKDIKRILAPALRGTFLGSILGVLPGGGATLSAFTAYAIEKKVSQNAAQFGHGAMEGVAAPEAANNAGAQTTSFVPMLSLGIPSNPVMALMIGAMIMQGIQPGPTVLTQQPALFWGIIASMWIGNFFLVVLSLPMIGLWGRMITVPYHFLFPCIIMFCSIGVQPEQLRFRRVPHRGLWIVGYICSKLEMEPAPLLLGFIIGPMSSPVAGARETVLRLASPRGRGGYERCVVCILGAH